MSRLDPTEADLEEARHSFDHHSHGRVGHALAAWALGVVHASLKSAADADNPFEQSRHIRMARAITHIFTERLGLDPQNPSGDHR